MLRVLLTHDPEDREAYYGRALPDLRAIEGVEVVLNPLDRDLDDRRADRARRRMPGDRRPPQHARATRRCSPRSPTCWPSCGPRSTSRTIDVDAASCRGRRSSATPTRASWHRPPNWRSPCCSTCSATSASRRSTTGPARSPRSAGAPTPRADGRHHRIRRDRLVPGAGRCAALGVQVLVHDPHTDAAADGFEQVAVRGAARPRPTSCCRSPRRPRDVRASSAPTRSPRCGAGRCWSTCRGASSSTRTRWPLRSTAGTSAAWRWTSGSRPTNARHRRSGRSTGRRRDAAPRWAHAGERRCAGDELGRTGGGDRRRAMPPRLANAATRHRPAAPGGRR